MISFKKLCTPSALKDTSEVCEQSVSAPDNHSFLVEVDIGVWIWTFSFKFLKTVSSKPLNRGPVN